jgi:polyisoprenoid-binding protein YceI
VVRPARSPWTWSSWARTRSDPWGNDKAAFEARATIAREDFGITWNQALETGGVLVGKELTVELLVQLQPAG